MFRFFPRGFGKPLRNLPFFTRARHGQPCDFRPQSIHFTSGPARRATKLALFQPGRDAADNYSCHHGEEHDDIERRHDLGSLWHGTGEGIEEYGHLMPVRDCQGQNNKRDREQKKEFEKPLHLRPPMDSRPYTVRF